MVHRFVSTLKIIISSRQCQNLKRMIDDHSKTLLKTFLEITPKSSRNYWRAAYKALVCNLSIKLHFLHSHISNFPEDLSKITDKEGERYHLDLKVME